MELSDQKLKADTKKLNNSGAFKLSDKLCWREETQRASEGEKIKRGRATLLSTPPPNKWESQSKSCCLSLLLCCDVAQAEPSAEQTAVRTSTQTQGQPSLLRAGAPLSNSRLAIAASPPLRHVPRREPGVWRGSHCGLPGRVL